MEKNKAANCRNFLGVDVTPFPESKNIVYTCCQPYCLDADNCDRQRVEEKPAVQFEPIEE